jgi:hypothetical protein
MADHSFITLYVHIGSRILALLSDIGDWIGDLLFNLVFLVLGIVFAIGLLLPLLPIVQACGMD